MQKSFSVTMKDVFLKPGQQMADFMGELKALSAEDKKWYYDALIKEGYDCQPPQIVPAAQ